MLVGAGLIVTEFALRKVVPQQFAGHVREFLHLSDDHSVEVELEGVLLQQLIVGIFNNVQVSVADAPLADGLRANLFAHASKMPKNPMEGQIIDGVVGVTFDSEQLSEVVRVLSRGVGQEVEIEKDHLTVSNSISLFGQKIPLKISFELAANDGQLHINPVGIEAAGLIGFTVDQLQNVPGLTQLAEGFDICIADKLPDGVSLEKITLSTAGTLTVTGEINPEIGMNAALQEFGVC